MKDMLLEIMENMGISVPRDEDVNLFEYIIDSIQYITFIVEIETQLGFELPPEALLYDNVISMNGFVNMLESIVEENNKRRSDE